MIDRCCIKVLIVPALLVLFCIGNNNAQPMSNRLYQIIPDSLKPRMIDSPTREELVRILINPPRGVDSLQRDELQHICYRLGQQYSSISNSMKRVHTLYAVCFGLASFLNLGQTDSLEKYADKLLVEARAGWPRYKNWYAEALIRKADVLRLKFRFTEAFECLHEAMELYSDSDNQKVRLNIFNYTVCFYLFLDRPDKVLIYLDSFATCMDPMSPVYKTVILPDYYTGKASAYILRYKKSKAQKDADSALVYLDQLSREGDIKQQTTNHGFRAMLAYYQQDYPRSLLETDTALLPRYADVDFYSQDQCVIVCLKGLALIKTGMVVAGKALLENNQSCYRAVLQGDIYQALYQLEKQQGNYAAALNYYEQYAAYQDKVNLIEQQARIFELDQQYAIAKKEATIRQISQEKKQQHQLILALVVGLILLGVIFFLVYKAGRRKLAASLRQIDNITELQIFKIEEAAAKAKEHERRILGAELHNNIASTLSAAAIFLQRKTRLETDTSEQPVWKMLIGALNELYEQVRDRSHGLFLPETQSDVFVEELKKNIAFFFADTAMQINMEMDDPELVHIGAETKICLLHIVKEGITNVLKYANASVVNILLYADRDKVHFLLTDNGKGIAAPSGKKAGIGLSALRHRVEMLSGQFDIGSSDQGTTIKVVLPL